jgi:uncharacterized membrane protein
MIDFFLVGIAFSITLANALGDDAGVAFGVASVLAVLALHPRRVLEKVPTQSTTHDVVKLVLNKLVSVQLVDLFLALSNGTLAAQAEIHGAPVIILLDEAHLQLNLASRLQIKPAVDGLRHDLRLRPWSSKGRVELTTYR